MRLLLTGAAGRLGGAVAARLAARADIELIASRRDAVSGGPALDLGDPAAIDEALRRATPDVVVHAAGRPAGAPDRLLADTTLATANLAVAVGRAAPRAKLLLIGCASVYGARAEPGLLRETDATAPIDLAGVAALAAERCASGACDRAGVALTVLRVFDLVDVGRIGAPGLVRDLVCADDVARAVEAAIDRGVWDETINVGSGVGAAPAEPPTAWLVADPGRCEALLGFRPGADDVATRAAGASR